MGDVVQLPPLPALGSRSIRNIEDMRNAFDNRASQLNLSVDCPCDGMLLSRIAVVAEAPGPKEVLGKSPLIGGSGNTLWTVLRKFGYTRGDFYITNVSKRQVAFDTDDKKSPVGRHELQQWAELLLWELDQLPNLEVILGMGNLALEALFNEQSITSWAGSVLPLRLPSGRTVQVLLTFNSAYVMRYPTHELIFILHCSRLKPVLEGRWKPPQLTLLIRPSYKEAMEYLGHLIGEQSDTAYDIETMAGEADCIGFANLSTEAMCIAFRDQSNNLYEVDEELALRKKIARVLGPEGPPLIAQNNAFDASWLWFKDKIKVKPLKMDTMLAHHTLFPWMPHGLGFLTTQYTMMPYYKDELEKSKENSDFPRRWRYNGTDVCATLQASRAMHKELANSHLDDFFYNHVMRLNPHLIRMTVGGVLMDMSKRAEIASKLEAQLEVKADEFYRLVQECLGEGNDYRPNPNSPAQLADLLFTRLKLVGRGVSTDDENRQRMYNHPRTTEQGRLILDAIGSYKSDAKFYGTYAKTAIDDDNRFRSQFKQAGTTKAPGRLSSSSVGWGHYDGKSFVGHGGNLQNQPPEAQVMFIADPGYCLIYFDLGQAEARYVGWDAKIDSWKTQFERARTGGNSGDSYDAHRALAADLFKVPYEDVPTTDREVNLDGTEVYTIRYKAKRCRHGLNYRMMADKLATTAGLTIADARYCYERYHRITPELRKWWTALENEVRSSRVLFNAFGRRLYVQGNLNDPQTLESIVAFKPQSSIGDKVCQVIYQAEEDERWDNREARVLMNIHDALIAMVPLGKAEYYLSILKHYAELPLIVGGEPLIIPADVACSVADEKGIHRWSTIKKIKNFEPMNLGYNNG